MGFSEEIRIEVRQKAAYQCCRCRSLGVEVHHIIPQEHGGPDDIDNAAPLCPNCHTDFGDNPKKRKIIKEMRDWWYSKVEGMYGGNDSMKLLQEISGSIETIKHGQSDISELKDLLRAYSAETISHLITETAVETATKVVNATPLGDKVHANVNCKKCGTQIGLLIGSNTCPKCKEPIN